MLKTLAPLGIAGLTASAALAVAAPLPAQAAGTTGPCSGAGTGNPVQHTGNGHHSFTDSHNNCVNFVGSNDTAYLTDSDFNLINMNGNNDLVHNFKNSNGNTITFQAGANSDTLSATNADGNNVTFSAGAVGDVITLMGTQNDTGIIIDGSNDFITFGSGPCTAGQQHVTGSNQGTASAPIVICT